jgi:AcrR family transcriptional regulator
MDDIAAEAGTSKTVIYRHFEDRAGLYRAVVERVDQRVVGDVVTALKRSSATGTNPRELISSTVDAYLALVESDTALYRFVVNRPMVDHPLTDDPVGATVGHVTDQLARLLEASSPDGDIAAATWRVSAVSLVGAVQAVADEWLASPVRAPRDELVESLTELAWHGLAPALSSEPEVATTAVEERR